MEVTTRISGLSLCMVGLVCLMITGIRGSAIAGLVTVTGIGTYTTIQAGVDACPEGGTVSVSAGTYNEAVHIGKGISLIGNGTPTIFATGLSATNTVTFDGTQTNKAIISGFVITGATNGIYCQNVSPTITNNTITANEGSGIYCYWYSSPIISNNTIYGNYQQGIYCHWYSSSTISNNIIYGNNQHGIYCYWNSSPSISNNTIYGNTLDGIYCSHYSAPNINRNHISGNTRHGLYCNWYSSPIITNNTIIGNKEHGIYTHDNSSPTITNNTISMNDGHGIYCHKDSKPHIYNNIIVRNSQISTSYSGISNNGGNPVINYNCVYWNGQEGGNNYSGCSAGSNDISTDPQFISNSNQHLRFSSACINAGSNTAPGITTTDKDAAPRIIGSSADLGAYEHQIAAFTHDATKPLGAGGVLTVTMQGQPGNGATFTIGQIMTAMIEVTPGTYTGSYTVKPGDNLTKATATAYLTAGGIQYAREAPTPVTLDTTPPAIVTITTTAYAAGTVAVRLNVQDDESGVSRVGLWVDNTQRYATQTDVSPGVYGTVTWNMNTTDYQDGTHSLFGVAIDYVANQATSTTIPYQVIIDNTPPGTPTLISVTNQETDGRLDVSWSGVTDTNLAGYRIYYGTTSGEYPWTADSGTTSTACQLGSLTNGLHYYLAVSAYDLAGNESGRSNEMSATPTGPLAGLKIVGAGGNEIGTYCLTTDESLKVCCRGYDAGDNLIREINGTWTVTGNIGQVSILAGTGTTLEANKVGTGTLRVEAGGRTDETGVITVNVGALQHVRIEDQSGQEIGTHSMTSDGTLTLCCRGYDADDNVVNVSGTWSVTGGIGQVSPVAGTGTTLDANRVGTGTICVEAGGCSDKTGMITVDVGLVRYVRIETQAGAEVGSQTMTTDEMLILCCHGYDADGNVVDVSGSWTVTGGIGQVAPVVGTNTTLEANRVGSGTIRVEAAGQADKTGDITVKVGAVSRLAFVSPSAGGLFVNMPGTITIQTQDNDGNVSLAATATMIILKGDDKSRFASLPAGIVWGATGTYTINSGESNLTIFFKQNGTSSPVVTASIPGTNISATYSINIQPPGSSSGTIIGDDGKTWAFIAANTLSEDGAIIIDTSGVSSEGINAANQRDDADPGINRLEGTLRGFDLPVGSIITPVRICIPYDDPIDDEYVDGTGIQEKTLMIYRMTGTGSEAVWQPLLNSQVDAQANVVYADVSSLSFFIIRGRVYDTNLEAAFAYPNPYYGHRHNCIYFERLTKGSVIRIFTLTGELVREIQVNSPREAWDVRNEYGEDVVSDMYLYWIMDQVGNKKVGKVGVIR